MLLDCYHVYYSFYNSCSRGRNGGREGGREGVRGYMHRRLQLHACATHTHTRPIEAKETYYRGKRDLLFNCMHALHTHTRALN